MNRYILLFPLLCIGVFLAFSVQAALVYPGGHYYDSSHAGFHLIQNYWCDLYKEVAYNGELSPSRFWALIATGVLGLGCSVFFYLFPKHYSLSKLWDRLIVYCGIGAMIVVQLLFTSLHQDVIAIGSILGVIAIIGMIKALMKHKEVKLIWIGGFALFLLLFNNVGYFGGFMDEILALTQKAAFLAVIGWLVAINMSFLRMDRG